MMVCIKNICFFLLKMQIGLTSEGKLINAVTDMSAVSKVLSCGNKSEED